MFTNLTQALAHNRQTQNPYLDLGNLGLRGSEPELDQLKDFTWVKTLSFSNEWYDWKKKAGIDSQNKGAKNQLTYLPVLPKQMEYFICGGASYNWFGISNISKLKDLKTLTYLDLSYNRISDISPIKDLKALTYLFLNENLIQDLSSLSYLQRLTDLRLHYNQITDISYLSGLLELENLGLSGNQISHVSALRDLKNLRYLYLYYNQITDVAPLGNLTNLEELGLIQNQIQDILPLKNLTQLQELSLEENPFLAKLLPEIQTKSGLEILQYWTDTYGWKAIAKDALSDVGKSSKDFTTNESLHNRQAKPLREAKVVFVGEGGAGKTSLMHALLYGRQEQTTRTEKIEIHTNDTLFTYSEKKEKLKLRFWDFGGQDIMHATHKFFMSSRTLYVLVIDGRKEETEVLQNWIEMLKSSIEDSPVLLVVNKLDEPKDTHRLGDLGLKAQFPNVVLPVIETSWTTGRGLDKLKEAIQNELQKMPHFQQDFSAIYQSIKAQLETIQEPYIDYRKYENLCTDIAKQEGVNEFEQASQSLLADILNDLGVMLNFRKKSDKLEDLLIFKPAWIVDGVYQLINAQETQTQKGKIHEDTVGKLLRGIGYSNNTERDFILNMMKHFKLAYQQQESVGKHCYLIPSLFDKNPPAVFSAWQASSETSPQTPLHFGEGLLRVRFQYEIWRNDYISYFLVTQHTHTIEGTHWANGAILQYDEQQARIEAVRHQKHIDIQIAGKQDKRYALWRIREALAQVHAMFDEAKLGISMWVIHEEAGKEDEFEYDYLKQAREDGEKEVYSKIFRKRLSISALLEGVSLTQTETKETIARALAYLEQANIASYFDEMEKVEKDSQQKEQYNRLRNEHIYGSTNFVDTQRLRMFAQLF